MKNGIRIELSGKPKSQQRPRVTVRGRYPVVYDGQKKEKNETRKEVMVQIAQQGLKSRLCGPISVSATFHMGGAAKAKSKPNDGDPHIVKPDIDNLLKYYFDVMNELVYTDDKQIVHLESTKVYSGIQKTVIELKEI